MNDISSILITAACFLCIGWLLREEHGYCPTGSGQGAATKQDLEEMENRIRMKLSELAGALEGVNTQLEKVKAEVQALKDSLSDVTLPAEAQAALDKLVATTNAIDDLNPDA